MVIKTVPHPPYSPDVGPSVFCLFPKLRGCRYKTIEEIKETVTKVIDRLTQGWHILINNKIEWLNGLVFFRFTREKIFNLFQKLELYVIKEISRSWIDQWQLDQFCLGFFTCPAFTNNSRFLGAEVVLQTDKWRHRVLTVGFVSRARSRIFDTEWDIQLSAVRPHSFGFCLTYVEVLQKLHPSLNRVINSDSNKISLSGWFIFFVVDLTHGLFSFHKNLRSINVS